MNFLSRDCLTRDAIMRRMKNNELTVKNVLDSINAIKYTIKREEKGITDFITARIDELIDYALGDEDEYSKHSLDIISQGNRKIIRSLCNCSKLKQIYSEKSNKIIRILEIIKTCIMTFNVSLYQNFSDVIFYLEYADNLCVYSMFESFITEGGDLARYLSLLDFVPELIESYNDDSAYNIFKLLYLCSKNPVLSLDMLSPFPFDFIMNHHFDDNKGVCAWKWKIINNLMPYKKIEEFKSLVAVALDIIVPQIDHYYEYQVEAVSFLTNYFSKNNIFDSRLDIYSMLNSLLEIYGQFVNHSTALKEVINLLIQLIIIPETRILVIRRFIPMIVYTIQESDNKILLSISHQFCLKVHALCLEYVDLYFEIINEERFLDICVSKLHLDDIRIGQYSVHLPEVIEYESELKPRLYA